LNFSAANIAVYLSNGPALIERTQSIGRIERPGAKQPMLIVDVIATGPKGQKTIDHQIMKSLRAKEDMARWTVQQWRNALQEE
jgi:superfamily II DNA or RNA helicase